MSQYPYNTNVYTDTHRHTHRHTDTQRHTHKDTDIQTHTHTKTHIHTHTHTLHQCSQRTCAGMSFQFIFPPFSNL